MELSAIRAGGRVILATHVLDAVVGLEAPPVLVCLLLLVGSQPPVLQSRVGLRPIQHCSPFSTPSKHAEQQHQPHFARNSISRGATSQIASASIGVLDVTKATPSWNVPNNPMTRRLSLLTDSSFPFPTSVSSPVNVKVLKCFLQGYSPVLSEFLSVGFSQGFRLGFLGRLSGGVSSNNRSASENVEEVSAAIIKELDRGHTSGPFSRSPFQTFQCSPLGAVPKRDGSTRIILDLSSPTGCSVNDGIPIEFFTVKYSQFDEAVSLVRAFGRGCFMGKVDIKHAFRLCPVHPLDWPLLGFSWLDRFFFDTRLPFGSRSSPFIFNAFADALCWILSNKLGLSGIVHYLDDFFVVAGSREECQEKLNTVLKLFATLGVPVAEDKLEGPGQVITYLGIEIDAVQRRIRLPSEKLASLLVSVEAWLGRKKCRKRELLSIIGSLSFACKVVKPGRMFLRRLIGLSTRVSRLHHYVDLNDGARADFAMWLEFLQSWDGKSFFQAPRISASSLELFSDASGLGCGGYFRGSWFSTPWPTDVDLTNITVLEGFAVYAAVYVWKADLKNRQIVVFSDNEALVRVWASGSSRCEPLMIIMRQLFFLCVEGNISISMKHLPGSKNVFADLLSRLQVTRFKSICHSQHLREEEVPASIFRLLKRQR